MNSLFWYRAKLFTILLIFLYVPASAQANWQRGCCIISSTPGSHHTAHVGETVKYDLAVDLGKCSADAIEWTWEQITPGLSLTGTPAGLSTEVDAYIRPNAPPNSRWLARARAFDSATTVTKCTGFKLLDLDVPDGGGLEPDLIAELTAPPPPEVTAGSAFSVAGRVRNIRSAPILNYFSNRLQIDGTNIQPYYGCDGLAANGACPEKVFNVTLDAGQHEISLCADINNEVLEELESNNCVTTTVHAIEPERPDLAVTSLTLWPTIFPGVGDAVEVVVEVANLGEVPSGSFQLRVWFPNSTSQTVTLLSLPPQGRTLYSFAWTAQAAGEFPVIVVVDPSDLILEEVENNNDLSLNIEISPDLPDLSFFLNDLIMSPAAPKVGDLITFTVSLRNAGAGSTGSFPLPTFDLEMGTSSQRFDCPELSSGDLCERSFEVTATHAGSFQFIARADVPNQIREREEGNNMRSLFFNVVDNSGPAVTCAGTWTLVQLSPPASAGETTQVFSSAGSVKADVTGEACYVYFGQNTPIGCWLTSASELIATWSHDVCPYEVTVRNSNPEPGEVDTWVYAVSIDPN